MAAVLGPHSMQQHRGRLAMLGVRRQAGVHSNGHVAACDIEGCSDCTSLAATRSPSVAASIQARPTHNKLALGPGGTLAWLIGEEKKGPAWGPMVLERVRGIEPLYEVG